MLPFDFVANTSKISLRWLDNALSQGPYVRLSLIYTLISDSLMMRVATSSSGSQNGLKAGSGAARSSVCGRSIRLNTLHGLCLSSHQSCLQSPVSNAKCSVLDYSGNVGNSQTQLASRLGQPSRVNISAGFPRGICRIRWLISRHGSLKTRRVILLTIGRRSARRQPYRRPIRNPSGLFMLVVFTTDRLLYGQWASTASCA